MNAVQFKNRPNALDPSLRGTDHFDQEISLGISYLVQERSFSKWSARTLVYLWIWTANSRLA